MDIRIWLWVDSEVKLLEHRYCTLEFIGTVGLEASKHANVFLRVCAKAILGRVVRVEVAVLLLGAQRQLLLVLPPPA